jgi:hypothetical protein
MIRVTNKSFAQLEAGLDQIHQSPVDCGTVQLIVCRPAVGERRVISEGELSLERGLIGDTWRERTNDSKHDAATDLEMQLTIMNSRAIGLICGHPHLGHLPTGEGDIQDRWALAGDQFYVDLDLSQANLPPGTRLEIGCAVVEVSAVPHTGCKLFAQRYGTDAVKFVNSPVGKQLRLRGLNAKVVRPGKVRVGDVIRKA